MLVVGRGSVRFYYTATFINETIVRLKTVPDREMAWEILDAWNDYFLTS
ncbi:MAG: hypothetical protein INR73_02880 [Williamsia sp.]|nr:hypothetical protein [Williamsia sp.]